MTTAEDLVLKIYPDVAHIKEKTMKWFCERAILTPKNDQAATINDIILLSSFIGEEKVYNSIDTVVDTDDAVNYPVEFLNTLNPPGLPYCYVWVHLSCSYEKNLPNFVTALGCKLKLYTET